MPAALTAAFASCDAALAHARHTLSPASPSPAGGTEKEPTTTQP